VEGATVAAFETVREEVWAVTAIANYGVNEGEPAISSVSTESTR
jgi:hypothetical protein